MFRYVNVYYRYQLNVNVVNTYFVGRFNTQPLRKVYLFDITFVMKIQTADRCNRKSSSFTNTRILKVLGKRKRLFPLSNLADEEIIEP